MMMDVAQHVPLKLAISVMVLLLHVLLYRAKVGTSKPASMTLLTLVVFKTVRQMSI